MLTLLHQPGVVLPIHPDQDYPEYSVYWLRDGCLAYNAWLDQLTLFGDTDQTLRLTVDDAILTLVKTQHVISPAGNVFTGGIEEAVFDAHLGRVTDVMHRLGSPAADGPPFRAAILIKYAEWLTEPEQNNGTWVADVLWPAIDLDLQWISMHWNRSSWDLWSPPVWGGSYWTASLQYRALRAGARLGRKMGRGYGTATYESHASTILDYLQSFWNNDGGYMAETTETNVETGGRSGLGSAPLMVSVLNFDPTLGCDAATFQPCSDRALSTLKVLGDAYRKRFSINQNVPVNDPVLLGRFLEDEHLGGHAQYSSTFNVAEQLFYALSTWDLVGALEVTPVSLAFFQQFDPDILVGSHAKDSVTYERLTDSITDYAARTVLLLAQRTPSDYVLPLAIDKTNGAPRGPRGAVRSLVAALGAIKAYIGIMPASLANGYGSAGAGHIELPTKEGVRVTCGVRSHLGLRGGADTEVCQCRG
ncbi:Six-hairpin glycosidase-like protein [Gloeopeniophorella convolvens]|nr:Six-hairpin glycosidase-like protein [Gloeopeniophorella convolvens]